MREYNIGDKVYLRDYPWGRPLNVFGEIVGYLNKDSYNVLLSNGANAGTIRPFKEWSLMKQECPLQAKKKEQEEDTSGEWSTLIDME